MRRTTPLLISLGVSAITACSVPSQVHTSIDATRESALSLLLEPKGANTILCKLHNSTNSTWLISGYSTDPPRPVPVVEYWNGENWEDLLPLRCGTGIDSLEFSPGASWEFSIRADVSKKLRVKVLSWRVDESGTWDSSSHVICELSNQPLQSDRGGRFACPGC